MSCGPETEACIATGGQQPCCDPSKDFGWRIVLGVTGVLASSVAALRIFAVPAFESPKFLINKKRMDDAVLVLEKVAKYNGRTSWLTERILSEASKCESTEGNDHDTKAGRLWTLL